MIICSVEALKKSSKEERNENKERNSGCVTTSLLPQKEDRKVKDWDNEVLCFDLVLVDWSNTDFNFSVCHYWLF